MTDKDIKSKCATDKFIDAFTHIILDHYDSTAHPPPQCILDTDRDFKSDGGNDSDTVKAAFKLSAGTYLRCSHVHLYINEYLKVAISPQKVRHLLRTMGVEKKPHGSERINHYCGLTYRDPAAEGWVLNRRDR